MLTSLIRKIHIYAGLMTFAQLLIYGIAGVVATAQTSLERPMVPRATRYVPFHPSGSATDKEVAAQVFRELNLPLTRPIPDWFLQRTPENHLLLDFYNINGIYRVVVLEDESRLRVEEIRNSTAIFLEDIHAATTGDAEAPHLVRMWGWWNEAGMWSLLGFCLTGAWVWLATRPGYAWAWVAFALGLLSFAGMWRIFR